MANPTVDPAIEVGHRIMHEGEIYTVTKVLKHAYEVLDVNGNKQVIWSFDDPMLVD